MHVAAILEIKGFNVITFPPDGNLGEAVRVLTKHGIGTVVVSQGGEVSGILSERDIVRAIAKDGVEALQAPASDYMTRAVKTCGRNDTLRSLMERMTEGRFRHIPVVESGRLAGIISIGDVVKFRLGELEAEASAMRDYIAMA